MNSGKIEWMDELTDTRTRYILPIVSTATFLGFIDTNLLMPVIALYTSELGADVGIVGLVVGLYSIINTPANILWGRLIDRIGFKIPLVAGLFGDALSMFLYSVCRFPGHLALVRVLHGITGAAVGPATMSVMADYSDTAQKGRYMGYYGMSIGLSTLAGFGLSGVIASRLGYKAIFFVGSGLLLLGTVVGMLLPRKKPHLSIRTESSRGRGWQTAKSLLRRRRLLTGYVAVFAQYFTFGGVVTLLPLFVSSLGMEAFHVGMLMVAFAVMFVILQIPAGIFSDRMGRMALTMAGLSLGVIALVIMPSMTTLLMLLVVMAIYGVGYGLIFPSVSALVTDETSSEERGMATGIFHALATAGVAVGAPVMGGVSSLLGVQTGIMLSAGILVIALAMALLIRKNI